MTAKTYATLNPNAIGADLELDQGNLVVTNLAVGDSSADASAVFATIPKAVGHARFDCYFYSTSRGDLSGICSVGLTRPEGALDGAVGDDAYSWGLRPGEGGIWHNGAQVVSGVPVDERRCITVYVNFNSDVGPYLAWFVDGNFYANVFLPTDSHGGFFWLPAVSIAASNPGDVSAFCNFGQRPFPLAPQPTNSKNETLDSSGSTIDFFDGWYEVNTEGIANLYLTIIDEAIVTAGTDEPSHKQYKARVANADSFSIKRRPIVWPWGDTSVQLAAYGSLQLDNYDGFYSFLVGADLRDTIVTIKLPAAMALGTSTLIRDAPLIATAILDNVTCDNEDIITITLKDTISRLDKTLPVMINPPFVDAGAANRMIPLTFGANRNRVPLLIDGPNRIYQWHDAPVNNLAAVKDIAAPLDPNATPPQYVPALNASGMQLETDPFGKLTGDLSSVGDQVVILGAVDELNGDGIFDSWSGSPSVPDNWTWSNGAGSLIQHLDHLDGYRVDNLANILSAFPYYPFGGKFGDQLTYASVLQAGKSYRITFKIYSTFASPPSLVGGMLGGIMVRSALSNLAEDAISPHNQPLTEPTSGQGSFAFEFSIPPGADRDLIFIAVASAGPTGGTAVGIGGGIVYDVRLELLGQYVEAPLVGMTLSQLFYEVLIRRAQEDTSVYDADSVSDIDTAAAYTGGLGISYDDPPNILEVLRECLDGYCGTLATNAGGVVVASRLTDPHDGIVIATFDETNVDRGIRFEADEAASLTTRAGIRRNQSPATSDSDISSDTDIVPAEVKARYMKQSQYTISSSQSPAGQYDFARGAGIFQSVLDDPDDGQIELDRVVGLWSPQVYDNGDVTTGKRRFVTFSARYDDPAAVGTGTQCDLADIGFGNVVEFNYPRHGFINTKMSVVGWEIFPFSKRIIITGFY
jgi:hypothetical protein